MNRIRIEMIWRMVQSILPIQPAVEAEMFMGWNEKKKKKKWKSIIIQTANE